jgi:transcriptional regulator GlxA family with amidase domain
MTEIALDCGFSDAAHFSRTFKERFRVLPSVVRKNARSAA